MFIGFVNLMKHYDLCPRFVYEEINKLRKDKKYRMDRDAKVNLYKSKKGAEEEAKDKTIRYAQGNLKAIEFYKAILINNVYDALNEYSMLDMEIEMLEYRNKIQNDPEFKEKHETEMSKPKPKPFYYKMMPVSL